MTESLTTPRCSIPQMARIMQVQDSIVVAAEAMELYEQIADPSQMGR